MAAGKHPKRSDPVMLAALAGIAARGRLILPLGLVLGAFVPPLGQMIQPHLPLLVAVMLFLTAFRIGPSEALDGIGNGAGVLGAVSALQIAMPLLVLGVAVLLGWSDSLVVLTLVVLLAAPALSGSPNLAILLGARPEPAFRTMIAGTALLPLTAFVVFYFVPQVGDLSGVMRIALRLLVSILLATALGFVLRKLWKPSLSELEVKAVDGLTIIALVVIVFGLMADLSRLLFENPLAALGWLAFALVVNFGLQVLAFAVLRKQGGAGTVPLSIIAGNRNIALFLIALPPELATQLFLFIGCYQIPMYLTPLAMARLYGARA